MTDELTISERNLFNSLPGPPESAAIFLTNVCIIEWLSSDEPHTGHMLHEWMNKRRQGWSAYYSCKDKKEVIEAIDNVVERVRRDKICPVLHLESHGGEVGLQGPNGSGGLELLTWDELTEFLQELNVATGCNLIVVVAACTGFSGIQALQRGPRAPAVALVGPDKEVMPKELLSGAKEFYRRLMDDYPKLSDMAESASNESGTVNFEWEPFAILAYEALVEFLVTSLRLEKQGIPAWEDLQKMWDYMFMIDINPENKMRFGIDIETIVARINSWKAAGID